MLGIVVDALLLQGCSRTSAGSEGVNFVVIREEGPRNRILDGEHA